MYCLCTRCIIVNSVQVRSEFGKFAYTAIRMRKCTLWSDNTCVFTRFHSVKNANTQLIWSSDYWTEFHETWWSYRYMILVDPKVFSFVMKVIFLGVQRAHPLWTPKNMTFITIESYGKVEISYINVDNF